MLRGTQLWVAGITPYKENELDFLDQLPRPGQTTTVEALGPEQEGTTRLVEPPKRTRRKKADTLTGGPESPPTIDGDEPIYRHPDGTATTQQIPGEPDPRSDVPQPSSILDVAALSARLATFEQELNSIKSMCRQLVTDSEPVPGLLETIVKLLEQRLGKES